MSDLFVSHVLVSEGMLSPPMSFAAALYPVLPFLGFLVLSRKNFKVYHGFSAPTEPTKSLDITEKTLV